MSVCVYLCLVCFLRNVLKASLFTQAPLHIFEIDESGGIENSGVRPSESQAQM